MDELKRFTSSFENALSIAYTPVKPWMPVIARFLLVATFLEDSVRIISQWSDQVGYLGKYRGKLKNRYSLFQGFPWAAAEIFLFLNVSAMIVCSCLSIARKFTTQACLGLFAVVISQSLGYGLIFDYNFFLRSLSVIGGLLMLLADSLASSKKKSNLFVGLPVISETDRATYLQLSGRILLVFLFLSFILAGEFSIIRALCSLVALIGCIMVVVGFKAKYSAWILIAFLSIGNFFLNNWWSLHHNHPQRDFLKYDFFQTLSIMGGFLLLINLGPGGLSMDEKKKEY